MTTDAKAKLRGLSKTSRELQGAEAKVDRLREKRDREMFEAAQEGATERSIAEKAGVDPAFVHRTVVRERSSRQKEAAAA